ncbi:futalosine synthase [Sinobaca qinghaiensis]|uniref:Chorismate dehydratase n=1 Tax=Sinobaca qinghaiensis TaxID=342944 RepID=A0A419V2U8_9BACL|nr:menaquinone biosynthesis protein [Sinobaca qinghaiensis]RKD72857.1 futalosine synthase [Sinobaca qinghaiensis]
MSLHLGEISYTNILPFFHYLDRQELRNRGVQFYYEVPSSLNHSLAEGTIDIAAVSSFAYAKNYDRLCLLPDLCVSSKGKVRSIFLISKKPITELEEARIALTSASATSIHLVQILLKEFYHYDTIHFETVSPNLLEMMKTYDACVLIGDDAIKARREHTQYYYYDLGEQWFTHTGLPMTYAVFAVQKDALQSHPELLSYLSEEFAHSRDKARNDKYKKLAEDVSADMGGAPSFWESYYKGIHYVFGEEEKRGLLYYYSLAYKYGFIDKPIPALNIWGSGREVQSSK